MDSDDDPYFQQFQIGGIEPDSAPVDVDDGSGPDPAPPYRPDWYKLHPGLLESLVPVWGPGRAALVDSADGNTGGAALNTALMLADFTGVGEFLGDPIKIGSHTWPATRRWMTNNGLAQKGQVVHHAIFERNQGIGKYLPDWFKNQSFNLKPMPSAQIHDRMAHAAWGLPKLNFFQQWHYGTPDWAKWVQAGAAGRGASNLWGLLGDWRAQQNQNNQQAKKPQLGGK